jgi:hypothetical protein
LAMKTSLIRGLPKKREAGYGAVLERIQWTDRAASGGEWMKEKRMGMGPVKVREEGEIFLVT